jgi:hypothetical protein
MTSELGIIIACYPGDLIWAKGCVGSLRQAGTTLPIMLLFDGHADRYPDIAALRRLGLVQHVLDRTSVRDQWLRDNSFGWGFTKMIAFWESPWERFIFLDADTAVSKDITPLFADVGDVDFVLDQGESPSDDTAVNKWFFATDRVAVHYPDFDWRRYRSNYYCTGVFAARRGAIPLQDYQQGMAFHKADPLLYRFGGEMGMLNLMIFRSHQLGLATFAQRRIQMLTADHDDVYLHARLVEQQPWVFHYAGRKPLMSGKVFNEPMTAGRRHVAALMGRSLRFEDAAFRIRYFSFLVRKRIRRMVGIRV